MLQYKYPRTIGYELYHEKLSDVNQFDIKATNLSRAKDKEEG